MCLGIPGKVIAIEREADVLMGKVDFDGVCKRVCLEPGPDIAVGDYALVHVGFAAQEFGQTGRGGDVEYAVDDRPPQVAVDEHSPPAGPGEAGR